MFRIDKTLVGESTQPFEVYRPPVIQVFQVDEEEVEPEVETEPLPSPEELVNQARIESDEIIRAAQDRAQTILERAQIDANDLKERAKVEGYEQGMGDAMHELQRMTAEEAVAFETLRASMAAHQGVLVDELKSQVLELAVLIAGKIINTALSTENEAYAAFVEGALSYVKDEREVVLRINAGEYERYFSGETPNVGDGIKITVEADEDLPPGSCFIETNSEMVNASVRTQLDAMESALKEAPLQ